MEYSIADLLCYFLIFSFIGWIVEIFICAIRDKKFYNRGFFTLPFTLTSGFTMLILIEIYPHMSDDIFLVKYLTAVVAAEIVYFFSGLFIRWFSGHQLWNYERDNLFSGEFWPFVMGLIRGLLYMTGGLLIQPLLELVIPEIPAWIKWVVCIAILALIVLDLILILPALRKKRSNKEVSALLGKEESWTYDLEQTISSKIWKRLDKAYPDWEKTPKEKLPVFAKGYGFYKMVWVFLISSVLGDFIETIFVGVTSGKWMSRSSLVYGPFSVVWGIGAILLTLLLHRLAEKNAFFVFLGGCVIGGVYEYTCSVVTEVFLGTSFWDYSNMPGNIGGRTNLLFCFFWGLLALIWVKLIYPHMSDWVEKIPVIAGTVLTWVLIIALLLDSILTIGILWRYSDRQEHPKASNYVEKFLDENYPDQFDEQRWQNMKLSDSSKKSN